MTTEPLAQAQTVGTYYLLSKQSAIELPPDIHDQIGGIVARQVALHGEGKTFKFKALGLRWMFVPGDSQPESVGKVGRIVRAGA